MVGLHCPFCPEYPGLRQRFLEKSMACWGVLTLVLLQDENEQEFPDFEEREADALAVEFHFFDDQPLVTEAEMYAADSQKYWASLAAEEKRLRLLRASLLLRLAKVSVRGRAVKTPRLALGYA